MKQLSALDSYFYERSKMNLHHGFICGVKLNKLPTREELTFSLNATIVEFPHLSKNAFPIGNKVYLKDVDFMKFDHVVEYNNHWKQLDTEVFNTIFQDYKFHYAQEEPLWKVIILEQCNYMILMVDHVLADGISTALFWKFLITQLNTGKVSEELTLFEHKEDEASIIEPLHPYDQWPTSWTWTIKRGIVKALYRFKRDSIITLDPELFQFNNYKYPNDLLSNSNLEKFEVKNDNIHWILNVKPQILEKILQDCKSRKVSLTAYLVATILTSLTDNKLENTNDGKKFNVTIPLNTRPTCITKYPNLNMEFGNFVGGMDFGISRDSILNRDKTDSNGIWSICSKVQDFIVDQTQHRVDDIIHNAKLLEIMDSKEFIQYKINNGAPAGTFEVTNLGFQKFNNSKNDIYQVVDAIFNEPQGISDIFTCAVISTEIGGLNCCISAPKNVNGYLQPVWEQLKTFYK